MRTEKKQKKKKTLKTHTHTKGRSTTRKSAFSGVARKSRSLPVFTVVNRISNALFKRQTDELLCCFFFFFWNVNQLFHICSAFASHWMSFWIQYTKIERHQQRKNSERTEENKKSRAKILKSRFITLPHSMIIRESRTEFSACLYLLWSCTLSQNAWRVLLCT